MGNNKYNPLKNNELINISIGKRPFLFLIRLKNM